MGKERVKCKDCKFWKEEDELPHITAFMECTRERDPYKYHFRGPEDSCDFGESKQPEKLEKPAKENDEVKAEDGGKRKAYSFYIPNLPTNLPFLKLLNRVFKRRLIKEAERMQNEVDGLIGIANGHEKGTMLIFETQVQSKMAIDSLEERGIACRGYVMQVELDDEYETADTLKIVE